jgi:[glutamine synthetase] adenylyltransferase / [glutamine synthetase]-adenylyl-L-tyrosine phosphorylase
MKRAIDIEPGELPAHSGFVAETWRRFPDHDSPDQPVPEPDEDALIADPGLALRRFRQQASVHILWRDLTGQASIAETGQALSRLAATCLNLGLKAAATKVCERHGQLLDERDQPIGLAILGLGKLGGNELNFNSDIDLVFTYRGKGRSTGPRRIDASAWLKLLARELIALIDPVTAHGRVWIIDTRLRPFGDAGALVWSVSAMEQYFLNEGRTWERYAWLKAGPVAGDLDSGHALLTALQPFIYRRYLDYGIFESLRDLHARIDAASRAQARGEDIKRGAGGIRELEFLVQSLQILRGGKEPGLRQQGFLPALSSAVDLGLIEADTGESLKQAYQHLRILENRLQAMTGRQGHHLPDEPESRARLALLMGNTNWQDLMSELDHHREAVRERFEQHFRKPDRGTGLALWPPEAGLTERLKQAGFEQSEGVAERLETLHRRLSSRALSAEGRRRLERLMPLLIEQVSRHDHPETGLEALLGLVDQISRRSAYMALLYERPATLERLVRVFRLSTRLAEWIVAAPQLLDDLLDPVHGFDLPALPATEPDDPEASLHALGQWRQAAFLRTGLAELDGRLEAGAAAARLTEIAETIIDKVLELISEGEPDLAVIAYGNLGAGLLHYTSDLDLVFLHGPGSAPVRSAQRLISFMQMPIPGGRLFEIDTRLRPNGRAGLLVSRLDRFAEYQAQQAWTWEHQALIRARWIVGNPELVEGFNQARAQVLGQSRDEARLRKDLLEMRQRQRRERDEGPVRQRLIDLQFIAELGVLALAARHTELIDCRKPDEQFERLGEFGWIDKQSTEDLIQAWHYLLKRRHRDWLERETDRPIPEEIGDPIDRAWSRAFQT